MLASNHKRILRNTAMLYLRMLLAMAVGLYTSRIVLEVLGVEDYGTYHVVAGFVALLGFMQGAMTTATQRYFSFDLGQNEGSNLRSLFNISLQIHVLMALCIALLAETVGCWFVSTQLSIQPNRLDAVLTAYHLSVAAFAVNVMTVPLTAMLMAHERMGLFALMSMADVLLKLVAVLLLSYLAYDKLSAYSALLLGVALITFSGYLLINRTIFPEVRLQWGWNGERFRSMLGFTAWSSWGYLAAAITQQGNNILLNIYFGPTVNAARGVANQANGAITSFGSNIQAAINPQIVKLYASNDNKAAMHDLVQQASKYNFFILLILAAPILIYTEPLLRIWLTEVPPYSSIFLKLTIVISLIDSLSQPMLTAIQAAGRIRLYQIVVGSTLMLNLPLSFFALNTWANPELVLWIGISIQAAIFLSRLFFLKKLAGMDIRSYIKNLIPRIILISSLVFLVSYLAPPENNSFISLIFGITISMFAVFLGCLLIGLNAGERKYLSSLFLALYRKPA